MAERGLQGSLDLVPDALRTTDMLDRTGLSGLLALDQGEGAVHGNQDILDGDFFWFTGEDISPTRTLFAFDEARLLDVAGNFFEIGQGHTGSLRNVLKTYRHSPCRGDRLKQEKRAMFAGTDMEKP